MAALEVRAVQISFVRASPRQRCRRCLGVPGSGRVLATQHYMLLQGNLIYTGITRGKRLVVLIGQKKALAIAVRNDRPQRRYSGLLASLRGTGQQGVIS